MQQRPAQHRHTLRCAGFTLVELTVVLAIISVMVAGALGMLIRESQQSAFNITRERMERIQKELDNFVAMRGRLPCPANPAHTWGTDAGFGYEVADLALNSPFTARTNADPANNDCRGTGVTNLTGGSNFARMGMVPIAALGLHPDYAFDGWGQKFRYIVDKRAAEFQAVNRRPADTAGDIIVNNPDGTARTTNIAVAVISHGLNGHGGYGFGSTVKSSGSTNTNEHTNCKCDAAAAAGTLNSTVIDSPLTEDSANPLNNFDDLVWYAGLSHFQTGYSKRYSRNLSIPADSIFTNNSVDCRVTVLSGGPNTSPGTLHCSNRLDNKGDWRTLAYPGPWGSTQHNLSTSPANGRLYTMGTYTSWYSGVGAGPWLYTSGDRGRTWQAIAFWWPAPVWLMGQPFFSTGGRGYVWAYVSGAERVVRLNDESELYTQKGAGPGYASSMTTATTTNCGALPVNPATAGGFVHFSEDPGYVPPRIFVSFRNPGAGNGFFMYYSDDECATWSAIANPGTLTNAAWENQWVDRVKVTYGNGTRRTWITDPAIGGAAAAPATASLYYTDGDASSPSWQGISMADIFNSVNNTAEFGNMPYYAQYLRSIESIRLPNGNDRLVVGLWNQTQHMYYADNPNQGFVALTAPAWKPFIPYTSQFGESESEFYPARIGALP